MAERPGIEVDAQIIVRIEDLVIDVDREQVARDHGFGGLDRAVSVRVTEGLQRIPRRRRVEINLRLLRIGPGIAGRAAETEHVGKFVGCEQGERGIFLVALVDRWLAEEARVGHPLPRARVKRRDERQDVVVRRIPIVLVKADRGDVRAFARPPGDRRLAQQPIVGREIHPRIRIARDADQANGERVAERPRDVGDGFLAVMGPVAHARAAAELELRALALHVGEAARAAGAVEHRRRADQDLDPLQRVDVRAGQIDEAVVALQPIDIKDRLEAADIVEIAA